MRFVRLAGIGAAVALAAAGSASGSPSSLQQSGSVAVAEQTTGSVLVTTRKVDGLGTVLVNSRGLTLYMFVPDHHKRVTCTGSCAVVWPPLKLKPGQKATAGGAAKRSLLGSDKNPSGGSVVTYNGWPLYTYVLDKRPGQATGQGVNNSGGLWYVLSPAGKVITRKVR